MRRKPYFLAIHNKILVQWIFYFNKYLQNVEQSKKCCPHLSSVLACRTGLEYWLHLRANWISCISQTSARDGTRWVRAAQRHWADGSREMKPREHITSASHVLQDSPLQSCCDWFHGKGSQLQPRSDWSTSYPHPEFSSFSINFLPKLFSRKVVSQPTVMYFTSVKLKNPVQTNSTGLALLFGLLGVWKSILWLCRWLSSGGMWFLNAISVVKLCKKLWCLTCWSIKACCYVRNDAVALFSLVGIAKMGRKYQQKV